MDDGDLPQAGETLGDKYLIERVLGQGAMGIVYAATHRMTGKRLAIKCLLPRHVHRPEVVERFEREARATARLRHRNLVDVFDVGRDGDRLYLVMEYLEGMTLSAFVRDLQPSLAVALGVLVRTMEGVSAAHRQGVLHRDLKPENIFVCLHADGSLDEPRVVDFGISKLEGDPAGLPTRSGVALGTPKYMSLEQIMGRRDVDVRADVYSLGVMLYELMAGRPPHTHDNVAALAIEVATTAPVDLAQHRPDLPPGLAEVVMKAIARDREQRHPSVAALIGALRPHVERLAELEGRSATSGPSLPAEWSSEVTSPEQTTFDAFVQAVSTPPAPSAPGATAGSFSRRRAFALGAASTLLAGAVVGLWLGQEDGSASKAGAGNARTGSLAPPQPAPTKQALAPLAGRPEPARHSPIEADAGVHDEASESTARGAAGRVSPTRERTPRGKARTASAGARPTARPSNEPHEPSPLPASPAPQEQREPSPAPAPSSASSRRTDLLHQEEF